MHKMFQILEEKIETKADVPSRSEMYDILMEFRVKIKKEMTSEFSGFRNWHNLLMTHIANSIIDNKIKSKKSLKEDPTFQHYYDSKQSNSFIKKSIDVPSQQTSLRQQSVNTHLQLDNRSEGINFTK